MTDDSTDPMDVAIEKILYAMEMAKPEDSSDARAIGSAGWMTVPLTYFDAAIPIFLKESLFDAHSEGADFFFADVTPDVVPGFDVKTIGDLYGGEFAAWRFRQLPLSRLRGKVNPSSIYVAELAAAAIGTDSEYVGYRSIYNWSPKENLWLCVTPSASGRGMYTKEPTPGTDSIIRAAMAIALSRRYWWEVKFQIGEGIGISFPTDPQGAKEAFKLREVPAGKSRRAALRHWVRAHWRRSGRGNHAEVREHLRGATSFDWSDFRCTIKESAYDAAKNQQKATKEASDA